MAVLLLVAALLTLPPFLVADARSAENPLSSTVPALGGQPDGGNDGGSDDDEGGAGEEDGDAAGEAPDEPSPLQVELPQFVGEPLSASAWKTYLRAVLRAFAENLPDLLVALARALLVLLVFWFLFRVLAGVLGGFLRRSNADPSVGQIVSRLIKYVLVVFALIMAASQLGFNVGSVLAGIGIAGLALGLAAQESLSNLVAGLTILLDRPYRVGDNVTIAGTFGKVQKIGLRTTRILTVERLDTILPNREIINQKIVNHTSNPHLRLAVVVSIAYKEDTRAARAALLAAVAGHELIHEEPASEVAVVRLAESGVDLELRVWLRDPHREREALWEFTELAKIALDEAGIEIPFPQRTLHFAGGGPGAAALRAAAGGADEGAASESAERRE
jgi:small conductance mechanosensitive channel